MYDEAAVMLETYEGVDKDDLKSGIQFGLGVFNLFLSILPPSVVYVAGSVDDLFLPILSLPSSCRGSRVQIRQSRRPSPVTRIAKRWPSVQPGFCTVPAVLFRPDLYTYRVAN